MMDTKHAVLTNVEENRIKVRFVLSESDQAAGVAAENLWAEPLGMDRYRIDNIPFYTYGVSLNDIVHIVDVGGVPTFDQVIAHSGHSTYRLLLNEGIAIASPQFEPWWARLECLGCSREVGGKRVVSIDVPADANVFTVYKVLEQGEADGIWTFEEAHCGHSVT